MKKFKYHFVYKITNDFDDRYYIGKHSTDNLDDNYYGSGIIIKNLINKYGKEHFKKEIIKFFDTSLEAFKYEEYLVNENLLEDKNCINLQIGGRGSHINYDENFSIKQSLLNKGKVIVKDKTGKSFKVDCNDERYLNGELVSINKGLKRSSEVKEKLSKIRIEICKNPTEKMKNAWKENAKNRVGKKLNISPEGKLKHLEVNKRPKSHETKLKLSNKIHICKLENNIQLHKFINKELLNNYINDGWVNGMYAIHRVYIHKKENGIIQNKRIPENELNYYLENGWLRGRGICTFKICDNNHHMKLEEKEKRKNRKHIYRYVNNIIERKLVKNDELSKYINDGWILGKK